MAKRKRLSPAAIIGSGPAPETKSVRPGMSRAPIADVTGDAAREAAFEKVSGELTRAREEGRLVLSLPVGAVDETHLVRDRLVVRGDEVQTLMDSLRERGQQTPIEVEDLGDGRYGLISGWRRLMALRSMFTAEEDPRFATVRAFVRQPDGAADAYKAMVEENEIRADLSFYERARIAVKAAEQGIYRDAKEAVQSLFSAARAPKRSKILTFTGLVAALDDKLSFPASIPEKLGLALAGALQADPGFRRRVTEALRKAAPDDAAAERKVLERALQAPAPSRAPSETAAPGITLRRSRAGVTLTGAGVDDALVADLHAWLKARG